MSKRRARSAKQFEDDGIDVAWRWLFGVIAELPIAAYGLRCLVAQQAAIPSRHFLPLIPLHGTPAISVGVICLGMAAFGHFRCFWGQHPRLSRYAEVGQVASLLAIAGGLLGVILGILVWG